MKTMLTNVIKMVVRESRNQGLSASDIASKLDMDIIDLLITFIDNHSEFHTHHHSVEFNNVDEREHGSYCRYTGDVYINEALINNLTKRVCIGLGEHQLVQLTTTMLHEHRHAYQYKSKMPMCKLPTIDSSKDYNGYYNHPREVDARLYADLYLEEALSYLVYGLRKKYLSHTLRRESTTI